MAAIIVNLLALVSFAFVSVSYGQICTCAAYDACINNLAQQKQQTSLNCINTAQSATAGLSPQVTVCYTNFITQKGPYHTSLKQCVENIVGQPCTGARLGGTSTGFVNTGTGNAVIPNFITGNRRKRHSGGGGGRGGGKLYRMLTRLGFTPAAALNTFEQSLHTCRRNANTGSQFGRSQCTQGCTLQAPTNQDTTAFTTCRSQQGTDPLTNLCNCLTSAGVGITGDQCNAVTTALNSNVGFFGRGGFGGGRRGGGGFGR